MITSQVQSQVHTGSAPAGFAAFGAEDETGRTLQRASAPARDHDTDDIAWLRYCVRNHLI